jgi:hypothetical protein
MRVAVGAWVALGALSTLSLILPQISRYVPPWPWYVWIIGFLFLSLIAIFEGGFREVRKLRDELRAARATNPLKEKALKLGLDLFAFLREKDPIPPDPPFSDPEWDAKKSARWSALETVYHGYLLRFKQRVLDLFHELGERGIEDKPIKPWEELKPWEIDPPACTDLDVQKIAEHLFLLATKMDIMEESKRS